MRCLSLWPATVLAGALVLGCGDPARLAAPTDPAGSSRPSFSSGALVSHGKQGAFFYFDPDPSPGLTLLIGWTFDELELFCATGEVTIGSLDELFLIRPDSSVHRNVHGVKIPLLVWETTIPDLCAVLHEVPHLTGTGQFTNTDNDLFTSGNRTNAAHVGIHGQVASEAGEHFRFSGQIHVVILRNGDQRFTSTLQLEPFGK